jgi:hypothetical protein
MNIIPDGTEPGFRQVSHDVISILVETAGQDLSIPGDDCGMP